MDKQIEAAVHRIIDGQEDRIAALGDDIARLQAEVESAKNVSSIYVEGHMESYRLLSARYIHHEPKDDEGCGCTMLTVPVMVGMVLEEVARLTEENENMADDYQQEARRAVAAETERDEARAEAERLRDAATLRTLADAGVGTVPVGAKLWERTKADNARHMDEIARLKKDRECAMEEIARLLDTLNTVEPDRTHDLIYHWGDCLTEYRKPLRAAPTTEEETT